MSNQTEKIWNICRDTPMDIAMAENPRSMVILLEYKIHCVGCMLAPFHSVADAAIEHDIDEDELLAILRSGIFDEEK